jgi:hypothetical protein
MLIHPVLNRLLKLIIPDAQKAINSGWHALSEACPWIIAAGKALPASYLLLLNFMSLITSRRNLPARGAELATRAPVRYIPHHGNRTGQPIAFGGHHTILLS